MPSKAQGMSLPYQYSCKLFSVYEDPIKLDLNIAVIRSSGLSSRGNRMSKQEQNQASFVGNASAVLNSDTHIMIHN